MTAGGWAFFSAPALLEQLLTGIGDDHPGQLADQLLELGETSQRLLDQRQLVAGDVTGVILSILPTLELEVCRRMRGSIVEPAGRELAALHEIDLGDLVDDLIFGRCLHNVYLCY
jgi:hypothetical protein